MATSNPFIATIQEIPAGVSYFSPVKLELFGKVDRKTYTELVGQQAPPCDSNRKLKKWKDNSALLLPADELVSYLVLSAPMVNGKTQAELVELKLTAAEAATVNLPGEYTYPAWNPAPTQAIMVNTLNTSQTQPLSAWSVCLKAEADALLAELQKDLGFPMKMEEMYFISEGSNWKYVYPQDDPRRVYLITINAPNIEPLPYNAGMLLSWEYKQGVGSPGEWYQTEEGGIQWQAQKQFVGDGLQEIPVPCRALRPNEVFEANMFGLQVHVTDPAPVVAASPNLASVSSKLDAIAADVKAIKKVFGVQ